MTEPRFKIVFAGKIRDGFDGVTVRQRLASLYKVNPKQIERLFSGQRMVLKSGLFRDEAERFRSLFDGTGAACEVVAEDLSAVALPIPPEQPPDPPVQPPPVTPIREKEAPKSPYADAPAPRRRRTHPVVWVLAVVALMGLLYFIMFNLSMRGMRKAAESTASNAVVDYSGRWVTYDDPSGYYSLELPLGFSVNPTSAGKRSHITFNYGDGATLTIDAAPWRQSWDPDRDLQKHVIRLRQGREAPYSGAIITRTAPIQLAAAEGYRLDLEKGAMRARIIILVNADNTGYRIDIVTQKQGNESMLETLTQAALERLRLLTPEEAT